MTAVQNTDIANDHVAAELQTDRFVAPTGFDRVARIWITERTRLGIRSLLLERIVLFFRARLAAASNQSLSPNPTWTKYRDVFQVLTPDQAVVPVAVAEVLILIPLVWLGRIIFAVAITRIGGKDRRALIEIECDVAFQTNREGAIRARGKEDGAAARSRCRIDGFVDGGAVERLSIAFGAELSHLKCACEWRALLRKDGCGT